MKLKYILVLLFSVSCSFFNPSLNEESTQVFVKSLKGKKLNIMVSHNINGETHPCGCRHFPLGGLSQIAGLMHKVKKTGDTIYIDSGDTLFPSSVLPKSLKKSLTFGARNLAAGLDKMGLDYFTPGDQDFAAGMQFLAKLSRSVKFKFLISNLADPTVLKHQEYAIIKKGPQKIFILGFVDPNVLKPRLSGYFLPIIRAMDKSLKVIKKRGYDSKNPLHRLIIVSHSGMDKDKEIAKIFPNIDWVIGSHSQSFTTFPYDEGQTKLIQVLSRNHYMGQISIDLSGASNLDKYEIHEVRENLKAELKNNPFISFIEDHKKKLSMIQKSEQELSMMEFNKDSHFNTVSNCMECHQKQTDYWQGTAHSLAYITLVNAKEESNLSCVKCHSLGLNKNYGFYRSKDIVLFAKDDKRSIKKRRSEYWDKINKQFKDIKSIRNLKPSSRRSHSRLWLTHDEDSQVTHNFSGVQCLNCHDKNIDHPFASNEVILTGNKKFKFMKKKCLECHTKDQSPEWYKENTFGPPGDLDENKLLKRMKRVACPKSEEQ